MCQGRSEIFLDSLDLLKSSVGAKGAKGARSHVAKKQFYIIGPTPLKHHANAVEIGYFVQILIS